ncbi:MAG TPA: alpha/beta hydrolase [Pseudonocardiaceae bacterium]|nr:alpha/beta hydrolase [Pseudonocardiaceae bacterium]
MAASQITPHTAIPVRITVAGVTLAALHTEPDRPADAVALLLPGYTGSKEDFAPLLDPLTAAGLRVLAVDLPGQHESTGPDRERDYHPDELGRTTTALLRQLNAAGDRVLLLGHSYGGLVARAAVLAGAPVAGLTLLGSGPAALPAGPRRELLEAAEPILRTEGIEAVQRLREARDGIVQPPELAELLRARFLGSATVGLLGMAAGLCTEPDRVAELAEVLRARAIPCLVACGEADDAWPVPVQLDMAERLGAEVAIVPAAAHSPNTENPAALLDTLLPIWRRWLGPANGAVNQ